MQYTINHLEGGKVEIKVDVPGSVFEQVYRRVLDEMGKNVNIAGFRPGMAPADVLERHVGHSKILNEAASHLISQHLSEIFKKEDLVSLDSPKIAIESLAKESPFAFAVSFTQKPKVKLGDWKKIMVKKIKAKEITDEDINQSIKNIFEAWVKDKSKVESQKSKVEEDQESKEFIYDAHGNKVFFEETKESRDKKENKGSPSTKAQDEIDDNFARAIGARDLAHLKELVRKDLETIVADQVEAKLEQDIFEEILKICEVDIPDILVEDELNRMLIRLSSELEHQNKKLEDYLTEQKLTLDQLKDKWRDQAANNVKTSLILNEIGKEEKIRVEKEEVEKAMANVGQTNLTDAQKQDLEKYLVFSIFQAKTLDLVKKVVELKRD